MTNRHVVEDTSLKYKAITKDRKVYNFKTVHLDPMNDIAIIELRIRVGERTPALEFIEDYSYLVGQDAFVMGNTLGKYPDSINKGIISGSERDLITVDAVNGSDRLVDMLQTDAGISQGNSGGPLLDTKGKVIGMNTALDIEGENVGFAIPARYLRSVVASFNKLGYIPKSFLGIRYVVVTPYLQSELGLHVAQGALLAPGDNPASEPAVLPDSPAHSAGLLDGDIILEINGNKITTTTSIVDVLAQIRPATNVRLLIQRGKQRLTLMISPHYIQE